MIKEKNERERIALDDGSSVDYTKKDKRRGRITIPQFLTLM